MYIQDSLALTSCVMMACQECLRQFRDLIPSTLSGNEDVLLPKPLISEQVILNPDGCRLNRSEMKDLTSTTLKTLQEPGLLSRV